MSKNKELENILNSFANLIKNNDQFLSLDTVYYYFTRYNIPLREKDFKVSHFFNEWIDYFKDNSNIKVFVQDNWKYFCQFVNLKNDGSNKLFNPIKMYISSDSEHIKETAKILFDFLAVNNISHLSKIGSEIRNDDIVIRVYSKEDANKITEFINKNKYIKSGMLKISPFTFSENNIGYVLDGNISYNETICKYIVNYLNSCKKNNTLNNISYNGFYNYIINIYNQVFIKKENLDDFSQSFITNKKYPIEVMLNNYYEVTRLILDNLNGNNFKNFGLYVDFVNNKGEVNKKIESFKVKQQIRITKEHIELFNEYIRIMYQKYGYDRAYVNILEYIEKGNIERVTRTNDLRNKFHESMSKEICKLIMGNVTFKDYYNKIIRLNQREINITEADKNLLDEYIYVMYQKYGYETTYATVLEYIRTGNSYKVTRTNNLRDRFERTMNSQKVSAIVKEGLKNYMDNCILNNSYLTKLYLDKAIIGTFQKYNDLKQVITAVRYATAGDYGYFTNQNLERENLTKYVNTMAISTYLNSLSDSSIENYVKNCLESYEINYFNGFKR